MCTIFIQLLPFPFFSFRLTLPLPRSLSLLSTQCARFSDGLRCGDRTVVHGGVVVIASYINTNRLSIYSAVQTQRMCVCASVLVYGVYTSTENGNVQIGKG